MIKNMTKKSAKIYAILTLVILALCILCDILVRRTYTPYIIVSGDFIGVMFSALCTVAVLGSAFLSIVISIYSSNTYGFTLKEILNFQASPLKVSKTVTASMLTIIFAIPAFAFSLHSTITSLTIIVTVFNIIRSTQIWRIASDDEYVKVLINQQIGIIEDNEQTAIVYLNKWFYELTIAIITQNASLQNDYIGFIKSCIEINPESKNVGIYCAKLIADKFPEICDSLGIVDTCILFSRLNTDDNTVFDEYPNIRTSINRLKHYSYEKLGNHYLKGNITDLVDEVNISDRVAIFAINCYVISIGQNTHIEISMKTDLLNDIFYTLTLLRDYDGNRAKRYKLLLYIFRDCILLEDDYDLQQALFELLFRNLAKNNLYSRDDCYVQAISSLIRALFYYAFYEIEMLSEEHRSHLQRLLSLEYKSKDNVLFSINRIADEIHGKIVRQLIQDACSERDPLEFLEHFPDGGGCKSTVWTIGTAIRFAFFYDNLQYNDYNFFPLPFVIDEVGSAKNATARSLYTCILELFNDDGTLRQFALDGIALLRESLDIKEIHLKSYHSKTFELCNENLKQILQCEEQKFDTGTTIEGVKLQLEQQLNATDYFKYNKELDCNGKEIIAFNPYYGYRTIVYDSMLEYMLQSCIKQIVKISIEKYLREIEIDFSSNGIGVLHKELTSEAYNLRNYTYYDDLAIRRENKESSNYIELIELIQQIEYFNTPGITNKFFLQCRSLEFNIELNSYKKRDVTGEERNDLLERYKVSEGRYKINSVLYDTNEAISWIARNVFVEKMEFRVATNIENDGGFRVKFKR